MTTVWIVEYRGKHEGVLAHVASTREKAIEYCKNNTDYTDGWYQWYIDENEIDNTDLLDSCKNGFYVDKNGVELTSMKYMIYKHGYGPDGTGFEMTEPKSLSDALDNHRRNLILFCSLNTLGDREMTEQAHVTYLKQSDILKCPFAIMMPEHYREDGTCKCDDPIHRRDVMIPEWEYTEQDFIDVGIES